MTVFSRIVTALKKLIKTEQVYNDEIKIYYWDKLDMSFYEYDQPE